MIVSSFTTGMGILTDIRWYQHSPFVHDDLVNTIGGLILTIFVGVMMICIYWEENG
jgi:hypothetical protein